MTMIRAIIIGYFLVLLPWMVNAQSDSKQALHNYSSQGYRQFYTLRSIDAVAERFSVQKPVTLTAISFLTSGDSKAKARVRIFGLEGGYPIPIQQKDIIPPLTFQKSKEGIEKIELELPIPLHIAQRQFFIVIDSSQGALHILMDNITHSPVCVNKTTQFYHQALREDGQWKTGPFSFCFDVHYSQEEHIKDKELFSHKKEFTRIDTHFYQRLRQVNKSLALDDINNDGYIDMAYNGVLWINKRTALEPLQEEQKICRAHVFCDIDKDGWNDIVYIGHSREQDTINNATIGYNHRGKFTKEQGFRIQGLTVPVTVATADLNNDGYTDMLIAQTGYSTTTSQLILLYNSVNKTFEEYHQLLPAMNAGGATISDVNNDGKPDIVIADMSVGAVRIFLNKGSNSFFELQNNTQKIPTPSYRGLSLQYGEQGELTYLTPMAGMRNGAPSQTMINHSAHQIPMGSGGTFCDIDGDGKNDYITTSSCHCHYAEIYRHSGSDYETMGMLMLPDTVSATGEAMFSDIDNDSDPDIVFTGSYIPKIYHNTSAKKYHTHLQCERRNFTNAAGSKVTVYSEGVKQVYSLMRGHGLLMQGNGDILIGTKDRTIDSVGVEWSGDNKNEEVFRDIQENKVVTLREGKGIVRKKIEEQAVVLHCYPNPFRDAMTISYTLRQAGTVHIGLYDKQGSLLMTIVENASVKVGENIYHWHPENAGQALMNGQYSIGLRLNGVLTTLQEITYIH